MASVDTLKFLGIRFLSFILLMLLPLQAAQAESRVNGFFRADLVRAGVFEGQSLSSSSLWESSGSVSAGSFGRNLAKQPQKSFSSRSSSARNQNASKDTAASPALSPSEWDVSSLYPKTR